MIITESHIVNHVSTYARRMRGGVYYVEWNGKGYSADDTRSLVLNICMDEGVEVRP